jgi:glutaredoxin
MMVAFAQRIYRTTIKHLVMNSQATATQLIERSNVVLFANRGCAFSKRLRGFMASITSDIITVEVNAIPDSTKIQQEVSERSGSMRYPQLFVKGKYVGGALDVEALSRTGELERLIR